MERPWDDGAEDKRNCEVIQVTSKGLVVEMAYMDRLVVQHYPSMGFDKRIVLIVKHPNQKSVAEGDKFSGIFRREGSVEIKGRDGDIRRLPRWVYIRG